MAISVTLEKKEIEAAIRQYIRREYELAVPDNSAVQFVYESPAHGASSVVQVKVDGLTKIPKFYSQFDK
jgi:hypothetical protein